MERPGRVFSREQLLDGVWGSDIYIDERTVDVHVGRLRKAINRGQAADPIRTVRGAGYALDDRFGKTAIERLDWSPDRPSAGADASVSRNGRLSRRRRSAADRRRASDRSNRAGRSRVSPPQKKKSVLPGSPTGQRQVFSFSCSKVLRCSSGNFDQLRLRLDLVVIGERACCRASRRAEPASCAGGARLARPRGRRGRALGAAGKAQAMDLADHRVAGDAAELGRDLAGGQAVRPQLLQELDPLVRPAHWVFLLRPQGLGWNPPRRRARHSRARRVRVRDVTEDRRRTRCRTN